MKKNSKGLNNNLISYLFKFSGVLYVMAVLSSCNNDKKYQNVAEKQYCPPKCDSNTNKTDKEKQSKSIEDETSFSLGENHSNDSKNLNNEQNNEKTRCTEIDKRSSEKCYCHQDHKSEAKEETFRNVIGIV